MRIAIAGSTGFLGRRIVEAAASRSIETVTVSGIRVAPGPAKRPDEAVREWRDRHDEAWQDLVVHLRGAAVMINAAGIAAPDSGDEGALTAANVWFPALLASAAAEAGVRRFVHMSSAAVQGNRDPLDETAATYPFSPYSRSKALAERLLLDGETDRPDEMVVYRPTSVQGDDRSITRSLVRFATKPLLPVAGDGSSPLPVALVENVAAATLHLCSITAPPPIALHPWEGVTSRSLLEAFGRDGRFLHLPTSVVKVLLSGASAAARPSAGVTAALRRAQLLLLGQRQTARALPCSGFVPPVGIDGYIALARRVRGQDRS